MLPLLQDTLINEKKWFTEEEVVDMFAICQSLPGIVAVNVATYTGCRKRGVLGSIVSTFGVILPSWIIIIAIAAGLSAFGDSAIVGGMLAGFRAAAVGMIAVAVYRLAGGVLKNAWCWLAAAAAFGMIAFLHINTAYVILIFVLLGIASAAVAHKRVVAAGGSDKEGGGRQ